MAIVEVAWINFVIFIRAVSEKAHVTPENALPHGKIEWKGVKVKLQQGITGMYTWKMEV